MARVGPWGHRKKQMAYYRVDGSGFFTQEIPCSNPRESKSTSYYFASYSLNCTRKRNKKRKKKKRQTGRKGKHQLVRTK